LGVAVVPAYIFNHPVYDAVHRNARRMVKYLKAHAYESIEKLPGSLTAYHTAGDEPQWMLKLFRDGGAQVIGCIDPEVKSLPVSEVRYRIARFVRDAAKCLGVAEPLFTVRLKARLWRANHAGGLGLKWKAKGGKDITGGLAADTVEIEWDQERRIRELAGEMSNSKAANVRFAWHVGRHLKLLAKPNA
jgi:hypothetical protein